MWPYDLGANFTRRNFLLASVKLTKNPNNNKYIYCGYGIRSDALSAFSLSKVAGFGKNVIIFGVDNSSLTHIDNEKLHFNSWKGPIDVLDNAIVTAEPEYSKETFCLRLHYNRSNSFLYVNGIKVYQFKAKGSKIIPYLSMFS